MIAGTNTSTFNYDPMDYRIGKTGGSLGHREHYWPIDPFEARAIGQF